MCWQYCDFESPLLPSHIHFKGIHVLMNISSFINANQHYYANFMCNWWRLKWLTVKWLTTSTNTSCIFRTITHWRVKKIPFCTRMKCRIFQTGRLQGKSSVRRNQHNFPLNSISIVTSFSGKYFNRNSLFSLRNLIICNHEILHKLKLFCEI